MRQRKTRSRRRGNIHDWSIVSSTCSTRPYAVGIIITNHYIYISANIPATSVTKPQNPSINQNSESSVETYERLLSIKMVLMRVFVACSLILRNKEDEIGVFFATITRLQLLRIYGYNPVRRSSAWKPDAKDEVLFFFLLTLYHEFIYVR